ncbi:ABC transporter substrate-binding protein [Paenibacillus sp. GCM10012303]|uniref:ABC transporter substrate-binding protein n=1 Tax=Paenibacillus sp. GCM10012303 TaxID=3317340 RepID=UPI00360D8886
MKNMNRWLKLGMIGMGTAAMLSACGGGAGSKSEAGEATAGGTEPVAPAKPSGPVEINLVTPDATITPEFLERLAKKFPDYKINRYNQATKGSTITDLLTNGTPIDIIGRAATVFENDVVVHKLQYNMEPLLKQAGVQTTDFEPQLVNYVRSISDGGMYGIPGGSAINHVLFYNKTLFDQFGVAYPKDGMSWEETMQLAAKMTRNEGGKQYYGFAGNTGIMTATNQLSIPLVNTKTQKPTINTDERWRSYFQIIYGNSVLNDALKSNNKAFSGGAKNLTEGDTAMLLFNANIGIIDKALQEEKVNWDMVALPSFKEAPKTGSPMNSTLWGLTNQTRNREAAIDVIKYMVSDEVLGDLAKLGYLVPKQTDAIKRVFATEAKPAGKNWNAVNYNKFAAFPEMTVSDAAIAALYSKQIEVIVKGQTDMNTAFRTIEEEATKIIEENARK